MENKWLFVIDTENYAGSFEREMTAYVTGVVGDCEVGAEVASLFPDTPLKDEILKNILQVPDERGNRRPCFIYPTLGWFNHGMGGHFRDGKEDIALADYINCVIKYYGNSIYHGYLNNWRTDPKSRNNYEKAGWNEQKLIEACEREEKKIDEAKKLNKYPAYLSVAIYFKEKPSQELIDFMKERSKEYSNNNEIKYLKLLGHDCKINITGFRLIQEKVVYESYNI
jgi:hypothetical protein